MVSEIFLCKSDSLIASKSLLVSPNLLLSSNEPNTENKISCKYFQIVFFVLSVTDWSFINNEKSILGSKKQGSLNISSFSYNNSKNFFGYSSVQCCKKVSLFISLSFSFNSGNVVNKSFVNSSIT